MTRALQLGRARLRHLYGELGEGAGIWRFELSKVCLDDGEVASGLAEDLADRCLACPRDVHCVFALQSQVSPALIAAALRRRGQRVAGEWLWWLGQAWRWRLAGAVASIIALRDSAVHGASFGSARLRGSLGKTPNEPDLVLAVHGEWATRTRHVLGMMGECDRDWLVVVLGRPRATLKALTEQFSACVKTTRFVLIRPFSLTSALLGLREAWARLAEGRRLARRFGIAPQWRHLTAMSYRVVLGCAMSKWWTGSALQPRRIVFGHTGIADTSLLEQSMQRAGAKTIHVVHGISAGVNFTGCSSTAIFRCGHDADWHSDLGGYRQCRADVAERPALQQGETGLLLLTNLAHPMNPGYRLKGIAEELIVLEAVAAASREIPDGTHPSYWRPHPNTSGLGEGQYEALLARAAVLGYERVPNDADLLSAARGCRYLLCTASTVVIDLLAAGMLPILLDWQSVDPECALGRYPLRAQDEASLRAALARCADPAEQSRLYDSAWTSIRPSAPLRQSGRCDPLKSEITHVPQT